MCLIALAYVLACLLFDKSSTHVKPHFYLSPSPLLSLSLSLSSVLLCIVFVLVYIFIFFFWLLFWFSFFSFLLVKYSDSTTRFFFTSILHRCHLTWHINSNLCFVLISVFFTFFLSLSLGFRIFLFFFIVVLSLIFFQLFLPLSPPFVVVRHLFCVYLCACVVVTSLPISTAHFPSQPF